MITESEIIIIFDELNTVVERYKRIGNEPTIDNIREDLKQLEQDYLDDLTSELNPE